MLSDDYKFRYGDCFRVTDGLMKGIVIEACSAIGDVARGRIISKSPDGQLFHWIPFELEYLGNRFDSANQYGCSLAMFGYCVENGETK